MIIDTYYLLPLIGIDIEEDLLTYVVEGRLELSLEDIKVSSISLLELTYLANVLGVREGDFLKGVNAILKYLKVVDFSGLSVLRAALRATEVLGRSTASFLVATASALGEVFLTEDENILGVRERLERELGIKVLSLKELLEG